MQDLLSYNSKKLGLNLSDHQINLLLEYLNILQQWNKVHNLCAKADILHMLGYHLLDSISVAAKIPCENQDILDLGTGAGLPGIPLAITVPNANFTLLDSRSKKIIFLQHIIHKLELKNVTLALTRIENYHPINKFDLIISRGFSDLKKFIGLAGRLIKNDLSRIIAMKADPKDFTLGTNFENGYHIDAIKEIEVPLVIAKRCLVIVKKTTINL